ncbi:hypothetical protein HFO98_35880 [Rhizobium leguminosarum]|nr:hypothetical protein [Rhizobium leguminosarum]
MSPSSPFKANLVVHHFGTFLLCHSVVDGGRYRRTPARLAHDDIDHIVVSCLQRGAVTLARPAARKLLPGDVAVLDLSAPVGFGVKAAEAMHLILPRTLLPTTVAPAQPAGGRILAGDAAMGILIRKCLEALCEAAPSLRTDRHSWYPDHDCSEMDEPCEVDSSTLVAGGKASKVFQAIEAPFDAIAMLVDDRIMRDDELSGTV